MFLTESAAAFEFFELIDIMTGTKIGLHIHRGETTWEKLD